MREFNYQVKQEHERSFVFFSSGGLINTHINIYIYIIQILNKLEGAHVKPLPARMRRGAQYPGQRSDPTHLDVGKKGSPFSPLASDLPPLRTCRYN